jgi:universal stress protein F
MSESILVAIDLADLETARKVLAAAMRQSSDPETAVTIMTVVPDFVGGLDYRYAIRGETGGSVDYDVREIVNEALARLNDLVAENVPEGMTINTIVRHGTIYEQILQVAEELGVDQIVMGAHRPQLSDYLLGPNTARVVRHAKCSVNVIRHEGR